MLKVLRFFKDFYRKHWLLTGLYFVIIFVDMGLTLISPILSQKLIDSAVTGQANLFLWLAIVSLIVLAAAIGVDYIKNYMIGSSEITSGTEIRKNVIKDTLQMRFANLKKQDSGHGVHLVNQDADTVESLTLRDFAALLINFISIAFMLTYLFFQDWMLTLLLLVAIPLFLLVTKLMVPKIRKISGEVIAQEEQLNNVVDECFTGSESIRAANAEPFFLQRAQKVLQKLFFLRKKNLVCNGVYDNLMVSGVMNLAGVGITVLGCYRVLQGAITIGTIEVFSLYYSRLFECVWQFMRFFKEYKVKQLSIQRLQEFHNDALPEEQSAEKIDALPPFERLRLQDVSFLYGETPVFQKLSLTVEKGDKVLIVGGNGSGKSTLARLIAAMEEPAQGSIFYNALDYASLSPAAVRNKVILVPAYPFVVAGSVEDNFFGGETLYNEQLSSFQDKDIQKDGGNLSSGQKKQLQLLRCLFKNGDVYILDEPFNYVDQSAKAALWDYIMEHFADKTLLIISHDLYPQQFCSRTVTLTKNGLLHAGKNS